MKTEKKNYSFPVAVLVLFLLSLVSAKTFSQGCPPNYDFENGNTIGWLCKSGYYGGGPCPTPVPNVCPTFLTTLPAANNGNCINNNGMNAILTTGVDRHTIVSNACYGTGIDPNSINPTIRAVDTIITGNNYSFRLGDGVPGGIIVNAKNYARAEAIRLTFRVDINNAGFTYHYAAFLQDPGHLPEEQPRFEVLVTDSLDSLLPCGYYKVVAGSSNPSCGSGTSAFHNGLGSWKYTEWTPVALNLTNYIGQLVNVEFRTSDCFPCSGTACTGAQVTCNGNCCTTCQNGVCCTSSNCGGGCSGIPVCSNGAGSHSAYAYIDAVCGPINLYVPPICAGQPTTIHGLPGYCSYIWRHDTSVISTADTAYIQNPVSGTTYTIDMVTCTGCPARTTVTINGTDAFTRDTMFCQGTTGNFQLNVIPQTTGTPDYVWAGPSGIISTAQSPVINLPTTTTTYTVSVTDTTAAHCQVIRTETIAINQNPAIAHSTDTAICAGGSVTLTASGGPSNIYGYVWTQPPTLSSSISVTPSTTQTYTVLVTDTSQYTHCYDTATVTVTVNQITQAVVSSTPPSICIGQTSLLSTNPVAGGQYSWVTSGGTSLPNVTDTVTVSPSTTTNYTVYVTDGNGCRSNGNATVTINQPPVINTNSVSICFGSDALLSATGNFNPYQWSSSSPLNITGGTTNTPTVVLPAAGVYSITVTASQNGCVSTDTMTLTVNSTPPVIAQSANICQGLSTQLSATASNNYGYNWTSNCGANISNANGANPTVNNPPAGSCTFTVVVTDRNNCTNSATTSLTVYPPPVLVVSPNVTICKDSSTVLTASGASTYAWSPQTGLSSTSSNTPTATLSQNQTYQVIGTDLNTCTASRSVSVAVVPPPVPGIMLDQDICIGQSVQLNASGGLYFAWTADATLSSLTIPNPIASPGFTDTYYVTISNGGNCPPALDSVTVIVHPNPPIFAGTDTTILAGDTTVLTAGGGGVTYNWSPETGLSCTICSSVFAAPLQTTLYTVTTVDQFGCRNLDSVLVIVDDVLTLYLPSAFFPDPKNELNNIFYAYGIGVYNLEFYIFDRWGNRVFTSSSLYEGWDGNYLGKPVQQDVYVYYAKARSITGKSITKTGTVTVVR